MKKYHEITLKPKDPTQLLTGANCALLLDGQPLKGVRSVEIYCEAGEVATITLQMYGNISVLGQMESSFVSPGLALPALEPIPEAELQEILKKHGIE